VSGRQIGKHQLIGSLAASPLQKASWQLLSYAKATVTLQKEYACEQLNRARFIMSAMPYSSLDRGHDVEAKNDRHCRKNLVYHKDPHLKAGQPFPLWTIQ
jgi:hypothetical protein